MKTINVQGILYDEKSSYLRGPAKAPPLIRAILNNGSGNSFTEAGKDLSQIPYNDKGDFSIDDYFDIEAITFKNLEEGNPLLTLGGDHSITYPIIKAHAKVFPKIDILHIDAHADIYDEFEGDKYSHACPFARIMEDGLVDNLTQIGIRTLTTQQKEQISKYNVDLHLMKDFTLSTLPVFKNPLYISLDMDAFDPAFAPGVSHHEPGGLNPREVFSLINMIDGPIIGADIVEYNPERDVQEMTASLAAKIMKELWGKMTDS